MARRMRTTGLTFLVAASALCLVCQFALPASFVQQPRAPKESDAAAAAALGSLASIAAPLAATAGDPIALSPWKGPLYGADVCSTKPLFYFIAPLCDLIYMTSPIFLFPTMLVVYGSLITALQILLPATQPDPDLRRAD
eukprot:TRINITY_DN127218_c0_g1_i1.p1 TRINITY_DN127218_c0_g1~~TRINITY_DN127218_c0_g1_i1.p1  ORF type:complete len:161 (+),score=25.72 TRINITY_DN127218_c0_g1_i1:69-485(+)